MWGASLAAVGAAVVLVAGLGTSPADAQTRTFKDRRGDVGHAADVHQVKVSYNKRGVHVRIKVRNAAKKRQRGVTYNQAKVYFDIRRGRPGPEFELYGPIVPPRSGYDWLLVLTKSNWKSRSRAALCRSSILTNVRRDTVHVRISRKCLRNPDVLNLSTGNTIPHKTRKAPKRVRVAVRTDRFGERPYDWGPKPKRFYRAVRRG